MKWEWESHLSIRSLSLSKNFSLSSSTVLTSLSSKVLLSCNPSFCTSISYFPFGWSEQSFPQTRNRRKFLNGSPFEILFIIFLVERDWEDIRVTVPPNGWITNPETTATLHATSHQTKKEKKRSFKTLMQSVLKPIRNKNFFWSVCFAVVLCGVLSLWLTEILENMHFVWNHIRIYGGFWSANKGIAAHVLLCSFELRDTSKMVARSRPCYNASSTWWRYDTILLLPTSQILFEKVLPRLHIGPGNTVVSRI